MDEAFLGVLGKVIEEIRGPGAFDVAEDINQFGGFQIIGRFGDIDGRDAFENGEQARPIFLRDDFAELFEARLLDIDAGFVFGLFFEFFFLFGERFLFFLGHGLASFPKKD